jgi:hypothetical protein
VYRMTKTGRRVVRPCLQDSRKLTGAPGWDLRLFGIAKATDENVATFPVARHSRPHGPFFFSHPFVSEGLSMLPDVVLDQFSCGTLPR